MELFEENLSVEDRIESIIYRLCHANPQYKKLSAAVYNTYGDITAYYSDAGSRELPEAYTDRLHDYFGNVREVNYAELSAVYCGAVLYCIGFLYKQGYIK